MAYTVQADLEIVAGGPAQLLELCDQNNDGILDPAVMAAAQAEADTWIDGKARRLFGALLPFNPVPDAIRMFAANEAVYRLKFWRRVLNENDHTLRQEREATMNDLEAGLWDPVTGAYPTRGGGGTPTSVERTTSTSSSTGTFGGDFGRDSTKGYW